MASTDVHTSTRPSLARGAALGALAGVVAAIAMGLYAMVASYLKDTGFFTPLHHIASVVTAPDPMMQSMMADKTDGAAFVVSGGVALLGAAIHLLTGAVYGAILGIALSRLRAGIGVFAAIGLVYGALVFAFSSFVGLPLAAALFDAGDPIANMPSMAGWGTFLSEHLVFGVVAAVLLAFGLRKRA